MIREGDGIVSPNGCEVSGLENPASYSSVLAWLGGGWVSIVGAVNPTSLVAAASIASPCVAGLDFIFKSID